MAPNPIISIRSVDLIIMVSQAQQAERSLQAERQVPGSGPKELMASLAPVLGVGPRGLRT